MPLLVLRVADSAEVDAASDWLWSLGAVAIEERGETTLVAGFASNDDAVAVRDVISERWPARVEAVPDEAEWRDVWLKYLEPVRVGRFVIHPPWSPVEPGPELHPISIDPGRAFGSGHHLSTQLAASLMTDAIGPGHRVLDVGCGTGVLSVIAGALGAASVLGLDLDPAITELARTNAEANHLLPPQAQFSTEPVASLVADASEGASDGAATGAHDTWDVVVANMTRANSAPLMPDLIRLTGKHLILSGLLARHETSMADSITSTADLELAATATEDGWLAMRFDRS